MKIKILIPAFLLLIVLSFIARAENKPFKKDLSDVPRISFTETEYDFGVIEPGANAVHYFVFSNTGKSPLVITNVRSSCGCTVPQWPKTPLTGGTKDSLRVEYNTKIKGAFNKSITVLSNAENSAVELRIKGSVIKKK